jgi:hypothetical protein
MNSYNRLGKLWLNGLEIFGSSRAPEGVSAKPVARTTRRFGRSDLIAAASCNPDIWGMT